MLAKKWRVFLTASTQTRVSEVYFYDSSVTDLSVSVGGVANDFNTSNATANNGDKAFDRNTSTFFNSLNANAVGYVGFEFNSQVDVRYVDITLGALNLPDVTKLYLECADNDQEWKVQGKLSVISGTWGLNNTVRTESNNFGGVGSAVPYPTFTYYPVEWVANVLSPTLRYNQLIANVPVSSAVDTGNYYISGYVKVYHLPTNLPAKKRVCLYEQSSNRIIKQTFSDESTGYFYFGNLEYKRYYIVSFDHTGQFAGEVKSDLFPLLT